MHLFTFEPGDADTYQVLFGRLPSTTPYIPFYTVFGMAIRSDDPGVWHAFETEQVSEDTFADRVNRWGTFEGEHFDTAWRLWLTLTGKEDDAQVAARCPAWREDWRSQLPTTALG